MITCPRCQHQNHDSAARCDLCGAHLTTPSGTLKPAPASRPPAPAPVAVPPPEASDDLQWSLTDAPDLFGMAGDSEPTRRTTGNLPGLKVPAPRALPARPPSQVRKATEPSGLAKLLQDALTTNSGGKPAVAETSPAIRRSTIDVPAIKAPSSPLSSALPGGSPPLAPAAPVTDNDLSDFLLDALSQEQEPAARSPRAPSTRGTAQRAQAAAQATGPAVAGSHSEAGARSARPTPPPAESRIPAAQFKAGAITCGTCGGANPEGMYYCVHCGTSLHTEPGALPETETECAACSTLNPVDNRFCGSCGYPLASGGEAPNWQDAIASSSGSQARHGSPWHTSLVSINEDGSDGVSIPLEYRKTVVGRSGDTRFPTDAFLSPKHASISIDDDGVTIEDLYSLNGTFVKLRDEVTLTPGDIFLMGRQVLRFERFEQTITPKARSSDGTRYMGSPPPGGKYKLLQIGIGGVVQNVYCVPDNGAVLGREQGEIIFPRDKFMSSRHAQLFPRDEGKFCLVDLNSSNGTWIKIWEKTQIHDDDYVFLGQQLFRVELHHHV